MRSSVARSASEISRSIFFVPRFWRDLFVNAQKWLEKSSLYKFYVQTNMSKEREQEVFNEKMSEKGSLELGGERENGLKDQLERQATKRRLERKRQGVAVKRNQRNQRAEERAPRSST